MSPYSELLRRGLFLLEYLQSLGVSDFAYQALALKQAQEREAQESSVRPFPSYFCFRSSL